ncbi:MAG: hypothetical protein B7Z14_04970 [Bosea sp. 32-68-6]|nr:MAG: hypothetical protein B7Z14_04970 [Bosea sp. 32-68-6]
MRAAFKGDAPGAIASLRALLDESAADAPWTQTVRQRLARLEAETNAGGIAALPPAEQQAAIRGMVEGLSARLKAGGGTLPEWMRLIRSQAILGDKAAARESLALARERLSQEATAAAALDALAGELALKETAP